MSDRHAWLHQPETQELLAWLDYSRKEMGRLFSEGAFVGESSDVTSMAHVEIIGRCKVLAAVVESIKHGIAPEEKEHEEVEVETTEKEYEDA